MTDGASAFTVEALTAAGFRGFVTFASLLDGALDGVPKTHGIYIVIRTDTNAPKFLEQSCGGHFKGRDPAVAIDVVLAKWVENCAVVYIGKGDCLQRRISEYARFGRGEPIGHWGGRYIWQLSDSAELLVAWRGASAGQTAKDAEGELADAFKRAFGRLPFANISDPSRRPWKRALPSPNARPLAERALINRFKELLTIEPDADGRLPDLRPLVVETIHDKTLAQCVDDIARGDGRELEWTERPDGSARAPSLHSAFSSCGAALNTFGPWRLAPHTLSLLDDTGFEELRLEEKLHIFRGGRAPNLDCVLWDPSRLFAVESKLCEHLAPGHSALFKESYDRVAPVAHESWAALFALLKVEPDHFVYLDAAQLLRHYLGVRTQIGAKRSHAAKTPKLVYLYWEPADAEAQSVCLAHRREVEEFRELVSDPAIPFAALSHRELWDRWDDRDQPVWLGEHVRLLRERYDVALS